MTVAMVAQHWGTSDTFVYDQIKAGRLAAFKLGGKLIRVRPSAVAEYEERAALAAAQLAPVPAPAMLPPSPAIIGRLLRSPRSVN